MMTYAWQEKHDMRLGPTRTKIAKQPVGHTENVRWKAALKQKAGDGPAAPRRFSWEAEQ